jgi:hypothetical protein
MPRRFVTVYVALAFNANGEKEVLGLWIERMTRGRERRMAPILSHGKAMSGQCGFSQAAPHN